MYAVSKNVLSSTSLRPSRPTSWNSLDSASTSKELVKAKVVGILPHTLLVSSTFTNSVEEGKPFSKLLNPSLNTSSETLPKLSISVPPF